MIIRLADNTSFQNFFSGDIFIVTDMCLCGRCDDRGGELVIFFEAFWQRYTTQKTFPGFVLTRGVPSQVTANDHFYSKRLAFETYCYILIRGVEDPVRNNISGSL